MASQNTSPKKAAAKKTVANKTTAKKVVPETVPAQTIPTSAPNPVYAAADPSGAQPEDSKSATSVAKEILSGGNRWNTGRERDEMLKSAGHDPEAVRKEVSRLRSERRRAENK